MDNYKIIQIKEELPRIKSKTLKKTVQMTLIKVNQHLVKLEIGNYIELYPEGKEAEIFKIQGEALIVITMLHLGEAVEDIIIEVKPVKKWKAQIIELEEDTKTKVLITIKMVMLLEVLEVVETNKVVLYHNNFKIMMRLIIVQMMQILKTMLKILHRKS